MRHSNVNRVLLRGVKRDTAGEYRCEVTSKNRRPTKSSPRYNAKFEQINMEVIGENQCKKVIT